MKSRMGHFVRGVFCVACAILRTASLNAQIVADGSTSTLSNVTNTIAGDVTVGTNGSFTLLVLSDNTLLTNSANGVISRNATATFNEVQLVSPGARWFMGGTLYVGSNGANSRLIGSNGATVLASNLFVGFNSSATNNRVVVHGGTLRVTNAAGMGVMEVRRGTNVLNAGLIDVDRLLVTNTSGRFTLNGGTLVTRDANITSGLVGGLFWIGTTAGSEPATWDVRAGATNMNLSNLIPDIGRDSSFNRMLITNGALLNGGGVVLGEYPTACSNSLVLSGGSRWIMPSGFISMGGTGACNRIEVTGGAALLTSQTRLSFDPASTNNELIVAGAGSVWTNISSLHLGYVNAGGGHRAVVADGGLLVNTLAVIGSQPSSSNNQMLVTGAGTACINANLQIGGSGSGNRLVITNGGKVTGSTSILLGANSGSINNRIIVDGGTLVAANGILDLRRGTNLFISGLIDVDSLSITQASGVFEFRGGMLRTLAATIAAGANFVVGDTGVLPAIWDIPGGSIQGGPSVLPDSAQIVSGTYGPADYAVGTDSFPAPAPSGPYGLDFASIKGTAANGVWSLFIVDDTTGDSGSLNGWSLQIQTSTGASTNAVFSANPPIQIPSAGAASIYPSTITIAGLSGVITKITVMLSGLTHTFSDDLDVLLVAPGGQSIMLMSDAGGTVSLGNVTLAFTADRSPSEAIVAPPLIIGQNVPGCQLLLTNELGSLLAQEGAIVGLNPASTANRVVIDRGNLRATNASGTGTFEMRRGTNVLNAGLMEADRLLLTNTAGHFELNGGTLITRSTTVNDGRVFAVGNGANSTRLELPGGTHSFSNGIEVRDHSSLVAKGTVFGAVSVLNGGILSPGPLLGTLVLTNSPNVQGTTLMEISKNGFTLQNDQLQVAGVLNYSGSLIVSNIGAATLSAGNRFQLFNASAYAGAFSSVNLPPLPSNLTWTNKLLLDGSIEAVVAPLRFTTIKKVGINVIISGNNGFPGMNYRVLTTTDLATPVSLWDVLFITQFDVNGEFSFTNGIAPGEFQRYFLLRVP
jgi:T5SS/PEP-CTERM-associated repeat protein